MLKRTNYLDSLNLTPNTAKKECRPLRRQRTGFSLCPCCLIYFLQAYVQGYEVGLVMSSDVVGLVLNTHDRF